MDDLFELGLFEEGIFELMGAPIPGVGYYLNNYHPLDFHPDNYWSKWQVPITPVVTTGGSGMHRQRRYWDEWELQRIKEEEELIILMAGWLA